MKNHFKFFTRRRILIGTLITGIVSLSAFGWIVAHMVTRPLDVELHAHVQICQKSAKGQWEVIDEAGPENLKFSANLLELATGKKVGTDFKWETTTKNGRQYSAKFIDKAAIEFNPASGKFNGTLRFEITLDGKKAIVNAKPTSESKSTPIGNLRGKRAKGIIGMDVTEVTVVSANHLRLPGEKPMLLVCEGKYTFTPR